LLSGSALLAGHRSPPSYGGIDCLDAIGTHDDERGDISRGQVIDASNERIHAGAILVMHLGEFARLRERVRLID
jgi:hypothetical protein